MALVFFYHPDRSGGSSAYHWICTNYYDPNRFLICDTYHLARKRKTTSYESTYISHVLRSQKHELPKFIARAASNQIDMLIHIHTLNILDFTRYMDITGLEGQPKVIFSIRNPEKQLQSVFRAREYKNKTEVEFINTTKAIHFWNSTTYMLIASLKTINKFRKCKQLELELYRVCMMIKRKDYGDSINRLVQLAGKYNINFVESIRSESRDSDMFRKEQDFLDAIFCKKSSPEFFCRDEGFELNKKPIDYKQERTATVNFFETVMRDKNILDTLLYNKAKKFVLPC